MADTPHQRYQRAQARWPGVALDESIFVGELERRLEGVGEKAGLQCIVSDDLFLALACLEGDQTAIEAFERNVLGKIRPAIANIDPSEDFVDEVRQTLRIKLLVDADGPARLADYQATGPIQAWVNVSAIRTALNLKRSDARRRRHIEPHWSGAIMVGDTGDTELEALKTMYLDTFAETLATACEQLCDRDRALLRLHFVDGLSIDRIGIVYAIHRSTAARRIGRARDNLHQLARRSLAERLGATVPEAASLERLLHSQLAISFARLLGE